ncbi:MAG: PrsW family intramembrane metalloprotease [Lachnospiraceae bacterium]|nr:PrsW family intramembrane metalloprotease [Lachnospiraceae bacterium]
MLLIMLAILPALILMILVYKADKIEKEPIGLLFLLILGGILSALLAILGETIMGVPVTLIYALTRSELLYQILENFIVVALVEELAKFLFLYLFSWKNKAFNFRFDGVVYSVFVSLGFAAFENVMYLSKFGSGVLVTRALLAIPAHLGFAVFMGVFYGMGRMYANYGARRQGRFYCFMGILIAVLFHGLYDFCASYHNILLTLIFLLVAVVIDILLIINIVKGSKNDRPI